MTLDGLATGMEFDSAPSSLTSSPEHSTAAQHEEPGVSERDFNIRWWEGMRYSVYVSFFVWTTVAVCTGDWRTCTIVSSFGAARYSVATFECTSAAWRWGVSLLHLACLVACVQANSRIFAPGVGTLRFLLVNHALCLEGLCVAGSQSGDAWRLILCAVIVFASWKMPVTSDVMQPHEEVLYATIFCSTAACLWHYTESYLRKRERERERERERFFEERERLLREKHRLQYDFAIASKLAAKTDEAGTSGGKPGLSRLVVLAGHNGCASEESAPSASSTADELVVLAGLTQGTDRVSSMAHSRFEPVPRAESDETSEVSSLGLSALRSELVAMRRLLPRRRRLKSA